MLKAFAERLSPNSPLYYVPHIQPGWGDDLLRCDDRTPNAAAAEALGYQAISLTDLQAIIERGTFSLLYWVEDDEALETLLPSLPETLPIIAHLYQLIPGYERITWILPAATHLESFGTYVNIQGIAQTVQPVRQWQQMRPEDWLPL